MRVRARWGSEGFSVLVVESVRVIVVGRGVRSRTAPDGENLPEPMPG